MSNELCPTLDQCYYDLFIEYTSESIYFNREKKNLEDTIYSIVQKFNTYNEKALSNKYLSTKLENLDNLEYNEKAPQEHHDRFSFQFLGKEEVKSIHNFMKTHLSERNARNSTDFEKHEAESEKYSTLNINEVETVIKSAVESVARVLQVQLVQQNTRDSCKS